MSTKLNRVTSADVFKKVVDLGKTTGTSSGKRLDSTEVKAALDTFYWGDQKVTKSEVALAKATLSDLTPLSGEWLALQDFLRNTKGGEEGGFTYENQASAFHGLQSFGRYDTMSQKGSKLTAEEATAALEILGDNPAPARIAQVLRTRNDLAVNKHLLPTTAKVLDAWLAEHPISKPEGKLGTELASITKDLAWTSMYSQPVYPVELDAPAGKLTATKVRALFGEPSSTPVKFSTLDEVLKGKTDTHYAMDPSDRASAKKFAALKEKLSGLTDVQVIQLGTRDIDLYFVGRTPNGKLAGVATTEFLR